MAERVTPSKIRAFPGNHDFYSSEIDREDKLRAVIEAYGGHFAHKADIRLGGRSFLCCTMWTDMRLGGSLSDNMTRAEQGMDDYRYIRMAARG